MVRRIFFSNVRFSARRIIRSSACCEVMFVGMKSKKARSVLCITCDTECMKLKTSYIPPLVFSGVKPSDILHAPNGSVSMRRTRFSRTAKLAARFTAVVVFPTPPFGIAIVIILVKKGSQYSVVIFQSSVFIILTAHLQIKKIMGCSAHRAKKPPIYHHAQRARHLQACL